MQNRCVVPNCSSNKPEPQPLFRFPHDAERCKKWVENCPRPDLTDKPAAELYRSYRLCGKHFEPSLIQNSAHTAVLKDDAVPTIFDGPNQSQNGRAKRSKEMTKDDKMESKSRKKLKKDTTETEEDVQALPEGQEHKEYLKSLLEALVLLAEQGIPLTGSGAPQQADVPSNFQALLDYHMTCGGEFLKKKYDANKEFCSSAQLNQLIEVLEKCINTKLVEEIKQNGFFSLLTNDVVKISDEWHLPVFIRFVDQSNSQQERFVGFLPMDGDGDAVADKMLTELTDKWGLDMEQCRGQAHSCSGTHFIKVKQFASKLLEKYPKAALMMRSTCALNISLANGMTLSGVRLVMSTLKRIESFFSPSPQLQLELEHAITIFFPDREDKAKELKEVCRTNWTSGQDAFEVALEILEALLLCLDSVHDNEDMRWNDRVAHDALEITKALTDFEFVMALVVLKNTMTLTGAFGRNVRGAAADAYFAATSLSGVLLSLREVSDNIDVYHEFWNDEAVNLAAAMEIPVKVPRSCLRESQSGAVKPDSYYKEHLSVPVVNHIIKEMTELFHEDHMKALRCLSLIPAVIEQHKSTEPEEQSMQVFKNDIPNAATLSAELHCWWVKWSKRGKGETWPSNLEETLQLADVKFFPNMMAVLRLLSILPTLALEDSCDVAHKRFRLYVDNTPDQFKSKGLALLNMNYDVEYDLDTVVKAYMETYPEEEEAA